MKIFDATTVIAFLSEMDCPEGIVLLSKHHKIIIPECYRIKIPYQDTFRCSINF